MNSEIELRNKILNLSAPEAPTREEPQLPLIMGILNCTPDSFSDGGLYSTPELQLSRFQEMLREGASIVDIGAESTAPGRPAISAEEEWSRLSPLLQLIPENLPFSVDTYHADTAERAIARGAIMINDTSALRADPRMAKVLAASDSFLVLMYSKNAPLPHANPEEVVYRDVTAEISARLIAQAEYAESCGVSRNRILLDPGMGSFISNDPECSWQLLRELPRLKSLLAPYPLLLGTSRKGFLGPNLGARDPLSQLTALWAGLNGVAVIRTHAVGMAKDFFSCWAKLNPDQK